MTVNKSKSYLLPLYDGYIKIKYVGSIVNTYLFLEGKENKCLIIQYSKRDTEEFNNYINQLKEEKLVVDIQDKEDYIYIILHVPEELEKDFDNFIYGNFSKISNKNKIVNFLMENYGARSFQAINRIKQVLHKDRALKEELEYSLDISIPEGSELSSVPNKQMETIKI
jgi:hypothetical protein